MDDAAPQPPDIWQTIASLRQQGAERHAPLRLHFVTVLAQRLSSQQGHARQLLDAKLAAAVAACTAKIQQAQQQARDRIVLLPQLAEHSSLGELVRACTPQKLELKTVQQHRNTWSKLSAEKRVGQALEQPPANPGPINSHMLVLRSMALMRDASPDYMSRFMTYVDTLLVLQQNDAAKPTVAAPIGKGEARTKPKVTRGPSRAASAAPKK